MLSKILSTATLVIVAWLAVQLLHTQRSLNGVHAQLSRAVNSVSEDVSVAKEQSEELSSNVLARIDELQEEQKRLAKTSNKGDPKKLKAKQLEIAQLNQTMAIKDVISNVQASELMGHKKQGAEAAKLILSTKKPIWKLSEKLKDSKDALRGLMAPIDIQAAKWKRGDFSGNTDKIRGVLKDVLTAQSQS